MANKAKARSPNKANSIEAGFAMIRALGQQNRESAAKRKREADKYLKSLKSEPFVKQMRGLFLGLDTGLLTVGEMQLALSEFVTAEEARLAHPHTQNWQDLKHLAEGRAKDRELAKRKAKG